MVKKSSASIALLIGTLLLSACTNDIQLEEDTSSKEPSIVQIKPAYKPSFGDTETIGDLEYTFISLFAEDSVGSGDHAITGEKDLYSVLITIKNIGDRSVTVEPSFFTLISGPKTFFVAETATLYKNEYEVEDETRKHYANKIPKGTLLTTLEPGEERNGFLIFSVDSDTFITEKEGPPVVEKLEVKSNQSDTDTLIFYFS